jgi:DNA (cytosine-5)-methyltransferase 1
LEKWGQEHFANTGQYWYRCPHRTCRHTIIEPEVPAAAEAIDWTLRAARIGERVDSKGRPDPLAPSTIARIRENDGLAVIPGSFIAPSNDSKGDGGEHSIPIGEPLRTLTASGHRSLVAWDLLVPYYSHGHAQPSTLPMGALSTRDRYALATGDRPDIDISQVRFRMLATHEIAAAMGFAADYVVLGTVKQRTRQLGQAITPCLGEAAYSALIECISGQDLERAA